MHRYLINTCGLLVFSACFLGGMLAVAYASGKHTQQFYEYAALQTQPKETLSIQKEGVHRIPLISFASSWQGIFGESDYKRSSKNNPAHHGLSLAQHPAISQLAALACTSYTKVPFPYRNRSIYLLDCSFLM